MAAASTGTCSFRRLAATMRADRLAPFGRSSTTRAYVLGSTKRRSQSSLYLEEHTKHCPTVGASTCSPWTSIIATPEFNAQLIEPFAYPLRSIGDRRLEWGVPS